MNRILLYLSVLLDGQRLINFCLSKLGLTLCTITLGLTATLGFAPFNLWPVTLGTLVALLVLISSLKSLKAIFAATALYFTSLNLITLSWLSFVMEGFGEMPAVIVWPIIALFAFLLSLSYAVASVCARKFSKNKRSIMLCAYLPAFFIIADFINGYALGGFPWTYIGNTCLEGPFASFAPLLGVRGINALLMLTAAFLAMSALRKFLYLPFVALILAIGSFSSSLSFTTPDTELKVALVQGNIQQVLRVDKEKFNSIVATYWNLSRDKFKDHDLIVWPESALPVTIDNALALLSDLNAIAYADHTNLVTGILSTDANGKLFNSIFTLGKNKELSDFSTYNKRKLVPFGEFVPLASLLRPLGKIFNIPMSSFSTGSSQQEPLTLSQVKFTPAICYEAIYPNIIADINNEDTQAILMISNDGWFGPTRAPYQHLDMARMRSMELQKPMLRCTNNGITTIIDPHGQLTESLPFNEEGVLSTNFKTYKGMTPYAQFGDLGVIIIMLILLSIGFIGARRQGQALDNNLQHLVRP